MRTSRASRRYAAALMELADELKKVDAIGRDMRLIADSIRVSRDLELFFANPVIDKSTKRKVAGSLFEKKTDTVTMNFLYLLIDKGREKLIGGIALEFGILLDVKMGIVNADLKAPVQMDEKNQSGVRAKLEEVTGKKVRVFFSLDNTLVGGFVAQIGDTVYDGSVRRQLEILKLRLSEDAGSTGLS